MATPMKVGKLGVASRRPRRSNAVVVNGEKRCSDCKVVKPLSDYSTHSHGAGGRRSYCKACAADRSRRWRSRNRDKVRAQKLRSWHRHKERLNAQRREKRGDYERELQRRWRIENPERYAEQLRKYNEKNPGRRAKWRREWFAANRERMREWQREWNRTHPDAIAEQNARRRTAVRDPSPETQARIAQLLTEPCAYCGATAGIEIDHIVPISRGGGHEVSNLAAACQACNRSKHNKLVEEWGGRHR